VVLQLFDFLYVVLQRAVQRAEREQDRIRKNTPRPSNPRVLEAALGAQLGRQADSARGEGR
jgi:hypothetical protein